MHYDSVAVKLFESHIKNRNNIKRVGGGGEEKSKMQFVIVA